MTKEDFQKKLQDLMSSAYWYGEDTGDYDMFFVPSTSEHCGELFRKFTEEVYGEIKKWKP